MANNFKKEESEKCIENYSLLC